MLEDSHFERLEIAREVTAEAVGENGADLACGVCSIVLVRKYWPRPESEASPSRMVVVCPACGGRNRIAPRSRD